jgi:hypothetical protein
VSKTPKKAFVKMSLRVGTCRIFNSHEDVTCPLCRKHVPAGTEHNCVIGESPKKGRAK